jgi:hypothetical protein
MIAQQKGVSIDELTLKPTITANTSTTSTAANPNASNAAQTVLDGDNSAANTAQHSVQPLTDEQLATKYRGDADRLSKEAANLRRMAEELIPSKKVVTTVLKKPSKKQESD